MEAEWQIGAVNRQKNTHSQRESGSGNGVTSVVLRERWSK